MQKTNNSAFRIYFKGQPSEEQYSIPKSRKIKNIYLLNILVYVN